MTDKEKCIITYITEKELRKFALDFEENVSKPLSAAGFGRYNVFDILNISRQELRHSDFLAFLFDSNKSGEIGRQFLRNFLVVLANERPEAGLDFFEMFYGDIDNIQVMREVSTDDKHRIDILITFTIDSQSAIKNIVIAIENKVDSGENGNQLYFYNNYLHRKYNENDTTILKLFLSPDCAEPSENDWIAIGYDLIYQTLCRLNTENAENSIRILVDDYKDKIRREFDMNNKDEMAKIALEIYKNNKKELDYIFKCMPKRVDVMAEMLRKKLRAKNAKGQDGGDISDRQSRNIVFTTEKIADDTYNGFYFQINVAEMYFLFENSTNCRAATKKWFYENSKSTAIKIEELDEKVTEEQTLENECDFIINKIFTQGGFIDQCLREYESKIAKDNG